MKTTQDRINDLWNELVMDVYEEWKNSQIENDEFIQYLEDSALDAEVIRQLTDVYVDYYFDYDVFLDSDENQALGEITKSGLSFNSNSQKESV